MTCTTIESPVAASQLHFTWFDQDELPASPKQSEKSKPAERVEPSVTTPVPGRLSFTPEGRVAQPVRMGAVMIKLLKRYGITDAEIAEGVANYARKYQSALAS